MRAGRNDNQSEWTAILLVSEKLGCNRETLRRGVRQHQQDGGWREGVTTAERARLKALEKENRELRRTNEIPKIASAFFCLSRARPQTEMMVA